jgi:hypothetical protein
VERSVAGVTSRLAEAVAAFGIPREVGLPTKALGDLEFDTLLGECEHHRIVGFFASAVRANAFPVTDEQHTRIESVWQGWLAHAVKVERLLLDATEVLEENEIPSIVLKGAALAHTDYPDTSARVFGDVDLLVEPRNFTRATTVLARDMGAERPLPQLRPGFDDRFGKEILLLLRGLEFDVHRTFVEGPYGIAIDLHDLWRAPEPFMFGRRELLALAAPARTVHAAYAAALGDWPLRLNALRDFVQTLSRDPARFEFAMKLARAWRCDAVVRVAYERASHVFGPEAMAVEHPPWGRLPRRDRLFLASYRGSGRGYRRNLVAPIAIRGFGYKLRYLHGVAFPTREYLAARGASRARFARQTWSKLRADHRSR